MRQIEVHKIVNEEEEEQKLHTHKYESMCKNREDL